MRPIIITNSSGNCYRACPRQYLYRYELRLRRAGERSEALELGTLLHGALEAVWSGAPLVAAPILERTADERLACGDELGAELTTTAAEMVSGYVARWPLPGDEVEAVEQIFELPVHVEGGRRGLYAVRQAGKIDALRRVDGRLQLVEHKSAARVDGGYLERLWSDSQITGYCRAVDARYGEPCRSVLYDVVLKPSFRRGDDEPLELYRGRLKLAYSKGRVSGRGIRRRGPETDEGYLARIAAEGDVWDGYLREELLLTDADVARWVSDLRDLVEAIRWSRRTNAWPHHTRSCFEWQRPCEYLPICRAGGLEACGVEYETIADEHPELAIVAA
jgi:hypothetical protein